MNTITAKLHPKLQVNVDRAALKPKHKVSFNYKPLPSVIGECPLCHRDINTSQTSQEFVYEKKRHLMHKVCGNKKKLGNITLQEARIIRKKKKKELERKTLKRRKR